MFWIRIHCSIQVAVTTEHASCVSRPSVHFRGRHPPHPSKRSARGPQSALRAQRENPLDHLLDRQIGGVDDHGVGRRLQWGDRTGRIPQVPLGYLARKGGKANIRPLVFQLLIAPLSSCGGAGRQEDFQLCVRKNNSPHVPPVRDQSRGLGEGSLPLQQGRTHRRPGRHTGSALPRGLGADRRGNVLAVQGDPLALI